MKNAELPAVIFSKPPKQMQFPMTFADMSIPEFLSSFSLLLEVSGSKPSCELLRCGAVQVLLLLPACRSVPEQQQLQLFPGKAISAFPLAHQGLAWHCSTAAGCSDILCLLRGVTVLQ